MLFWTILYKCYYLVGEINILFFNNAFFLSFFLSFFHHRKFRKMCSSSIFTKFDARTFLLNFFGNFLLFYFFLLFYPPSLFMENAAVKKVSLGWTCSIHFESQLNKMFFLFLPFTTSLIWGPVTKIKNIKTNSTKILRSTHFSRPKDIKTDRLFVGLILWLFFWNPISRS